MSSKFLRFALFSVFSVTSAPALAGDAQPCQPVTRWLDPYTSVEECLPYYPDQDFNAEFCEFFVNSFGKGHFEKGDDVVEWYETYLSVGDQQGELLNIGIYAGGFHIGTQLEPHYWKVGVTTLQTAKAPIVGNPLGAMLESLAFFIDVKRPNGKIVRLWQSNFGSNFTISQIFSLPPQAWITNESGSIMYANNNSYVFASKRRCSH